MTYVFLTETTFYDYHSHMRPGNQLGHGTMGLEPMVHDRVPTRFGFRGQRIVRYLRGQSNCSDGTGNRFGWREMGSNAHVVYKFELDCIQVSQ